MSRCFPFPPPGYERKASNDSDDLLEKEKPREKKQKKEKKDKEKREGKERREKDTSDGKHREKRDKKEKHRDKDKDKERRKEKDKDRDKKKDKEENDKAKEKIKPPNEKRHSGQADSHGGEKLVQKESKEKNSNIGDKKFAGQSGGHKVVEKLGQNINVGDESRFFKDFGRRIKDDAAGAGNQSENFPGLDWKRDEGMLGLWSKGSSALDAVKEKDKTVEAKLTDSTRPSGTGNAMVQSKAGMDRDKFELLPRLLDKSVERNEKPKEKDANDKRGVISHEKDKEKNSHGKDKDRDREKKKEDREKKKEDREKRREDKQKKKEEKQRKKEDREKKKENKAKETTTTTTTTPTPLQHDLTDNNHATKPPPQLPKQSNVTDANPKKRKDFETNGVSHAQSHDVLPSKFPRPTPPPPSHPPLENGRILEHCQTSVLASERKVASHNNVTDHKDQRKINGITEAQPQSVSPMKVKPSLRQPHPDIKYLSLIYSVPKVEEWSEYDDQEWLFTSNASGPRKPVVDRDPSGSDETPVPQVWAEARQIESADVFALPYVIPY